MIILKKPIITEKSTREAARDAFTFSVSPSATKPQIKSAVESQFGVKVLSVRTVTLRGEWRRNSRSRRFTRSSSVKKAIVQLVKGQKIDLFNLSSN